MPTYHRSQRLRLVGTGPKVEQLQEGRFRLTFTCTATNPKEAWMNGNKDQIMTAYGTLQSAQKNIAGIDPRTDEAYSDMVLFKTEANPSERDLIITLVYETATDTFVKAKDDRVLVGSNQLQTVERVTVAKTGTALPSVTIGTTSIVVNSVTCVLTSRKVEENDAYILLIETYSQTGIISVSPVMNRVYNSVPMYQYRTLVASAEVIDTASAIQDPNGNNIQANAVFFEPSINHSSSPTVITQNVLNTSTDLSVADSSVLISSHDDLYNFLYPGVVRLDSRFFGRHDDNEGFNRIDIKTTKESYPTTTKVRCNVYNFIQRSNDIADTDFTYDGASGLWSPNSWATVDANIIKSYESYIQEPNFTSNVYTGYRINGSSIRGTLARFSYGFSGDYQNPILFYNGVNYGYDSYGYSYEIKITQPGPPDPIGRKWCLGVDIQPAFRDSNGNTYYNKQIIVTERIPTLKRGQVTYS